MKLNHIVALSIGLFFLALSAPALPAHVCFGEVATAAASLDRDGFVPRPSWAALRIALGRARSPGLSPSQASSSAPKTNVQWQHKSLPFLSAHDFIQ